MKFNVKKVMGILGIMALSVSCGTEMNSELKSEGSSEIVENLTGVYLTSGSPANSGAVSVERNLAFQGVYDVTATAADGEDQGALAESVRPVSIRLYANTNEREGALIRVNATIEDIFACNSDVERVQYAVSSSTRNFYSVSLESESCVVTLEEELGYFGENGKYYAEYQDVIRLTLGDMTSGAEAIQKVEFQTKFTNKLTGRLDRMLGKAKLGGLGSRPEFIEYDVTKAN